MSLAWLLLQGAQLVLRALGGGCRWGAPACVQVHPPQVLPQPGHAGGGARLVAWLGGTRGLATPSLQLLPARRRREVAQGRPRVQRQQLVQLVLLQGGARP